MTEAPPPEGIDPSVWVQYRYNALNVRARQNVYQYALEPVDFLETTLANAQLQGDETVLDVGCADGEDLLNLRRKGFGGRLIGLDIDPEIFATSPAQREESHIAQIDFVAGVAERLPFADDSVDVVLAKYMLYHVQQPDEALAEFSRVLRPGGKLVVATSAPGNKSHHRKIERMIAEHTGTRAPERFSAGFDSLAAEELLPKRFNLLQQVHEDTELRIASDDAIEDYCGSISSMRQNFQPVPTPWSPVMNELVVPYIKAQIDQHGYFSDRVNRHIYLCENSKTTENFDAALAQRQDLGRFVTNEAL